MDNDVKRELQYLREHFDTVIAANELRYQDSLAGQAEAVRVAFQSNEKRLDAMNEFRAALTDQSARMVTIQEYHATTDNITEKITQTAATLDARIDPINGKLDAVGKTNWTVILGSLPVLFLLFTGLWLVIGLRIEAAISPFTTLVDQLHIVEQSDEERLRIIETNASGSVQADAVSRTDRAQLNDRMRTVEAAIPKMIETETQFCDEGAMRNLMHAADLRMIAILWKKEFPTTVLPTDNTYYPEVCHNPPSR